MEYLNKVLGVKVACEDVDFKHLPNFIATRYRLQMVSIIPKEFVGIDLLESGYSALAEYSMLNAPNVRSDVTRQKESLNGKML